MKTVITVLLISLAFVPVVEADVINALCGEGIARESFGRGMESGVRGSYRLPQQVDQECFNLGYSEGQKIAGSGMTCVSDFWRAYDEGMRASNVAGGTACYENGYFSGLMNLHVEAREGTASHACVSEYRRGIADRQAHRAMTGTASEPEHSCYLWGYTD